MYKILYQDDIKQKAFSFLKLILPTTLSMQIWKRAWVLAADALITETTKLHNNEN